MKISPNRTEQNIAGQGRAEQSRAEQSRAGQGRAEEAECRDAPSVELGSSWVDTTGNRLAAISSRASTACVGENSSGVSDGQVECLCEG